MDMTKFVDEDDAGFVAVAAELRRWTKVVTTPHQELQEHHVMSRT